jgi:hypothetical protein
MPYAGPNEIAKKRMWAIGTALELRMKLRSDEPWMIGQFHDLYQSIIG